MDGFDPTEGIVVLAATNRPEVLDPALLRPGRFDRQITIPLPNLTEREAILAVHCRGKKLDPGVDLNVVARGTPGFSGADLANLVNEAAINAVRDGREVITAADFDTARDRIILGRREGSNVLLPEEKQAVAVHEAGHALVAALSPRADPVAKVTILPAGQALGVTQQLPLVERHLYSEDYLTQTLAVRLGGRAAELVEFGQGSTGAANDLASATDLATKMVREFGLSPAIGPVGYPEGGSVFLGAGGPGMSSRPFAEATQAVIDGEVARLLREAEEQAVDLLRGHRAELHSLVDLLLEQETVDGSAVYRVLGMTPPEHRQDGMVMAPARPAIAASPAAVPAAGASGPVPPSQPTLRLSAPGGRSPPARDEGTGPEPPGVPGGSLPQTGRAKARDEGTRPGPPGVPGGSLPQTSTVARMPATISVRDLRKSYGQVAAVDGVTFAVEQGEFFGILGPNGAGKTTTLEIIEGLREPDGGEVTVLGRKPWPRNPALLPLIGVQLQASSFFELLTAREQLRTFASLYGVSAQRADAMLGVVGLEDQAGIRAEKLSGGQAQRLSIACALVHDPELLFLDEPTGALDPQARRNLWDLLRKISAEGRTVVLTTHHMDEAEALCHRVAIMDHGKILKIGPPAGLIRELDQALRISVKSGRLSVAQAQALLPGPGDAESVTDDGVSLTIATREPAAVLAVLAGQDALTGLRVSGATLEDVFLELTGREYRA